MTPRYIGTVDFAPKDPRAPSLWQLEQPFAQVTSDGYLIICRPWHRTDGASIPRWLWPVLGHPFNEANAFWSQPHDQLYADTAVVLELRLLPIAIVLDLESTPEGATPWMLTEVEQGIYNYDAYAADRVAMPRDWADWAMREAMGLSGECWAKKAAAWSGVRAGGRGRWNSIRKAA